MSDEQAVAEAPEAPEAAEEATVTVPMTAVVEAADAQPVEAVTEEVPVQVRSLSKREIDIRIMPWDTVVNTSQGLEVFTRGAFEGTDPAKVLLMGLEHEAHLGIGQNGQPVMTRRPTGKGLSIEERADGAYMTFRVAKTAAGDEVLALAEDGIAGGASIEFVELPSGTAVETRNGRRTKVHRRVSLSAVSTTYRPAYVGAQVLAVRSQEGDAPVAEDQAPATGVTTEEKPEIVQTRSGQDDLAMAAHLATAFQQPLDKILDRLEHLEERSRSDFVVAPAEPDKPEITKGEWVRIVTRVLTGDRVPELQTRALQDVITTDNAGVVPEAFMQEMIGVIDPSRPFLATTRRLPTPDSGMTLNVPVINQRPTVGVQATEKTDIASQKTLIGSTAFEAVTIAGGGDLSLQIIKRSSPSFLNLWLELLGEAYAAESEDEAIAALLTAINDGGPEPAGALDPENTAFGDAYVASFDAIRRPPDTIWMSTKAVGEFIDAKASGTNAPLYPGLAASATAAGGITGVVSGLRPVHVPTLDSKGAYAIVGPSTGFAWAEDGTYTLQVDVPSKAGRDVALVGILWPAPWYPAAFTLYNVAS